jgi:putative transposase
LYYTFSLSFRDTEPLLAERGITVSRETVRHWRGKFGQSFANRLRRRQALLPTTVKDLQYEPRAIVTDKLESYGAAQRSLLPKAEHRQSRYLNTRAEDSHGPTLRRECQMRRFKSPGRAQSIRSAHAFIHGHFHPRRHLITASTYRTNRSEAFKAWQQGTCAQQVA